MAIKTTLTIAGSDSSGGAGIQADIKTTIAHGVHATSAITALTTQNTTGVTGIMEVTLSFLERRLDDIFIDIFPDVVKIGMISSGGLIEVIGSRLAFYRVTNVVVNPVMVPISGSRLVSGKAIEALKEVLLPMTNLLIPSIPETEVLSGMEIHNLGDMERVVRAIGESYGCAVLLKGDYRLNDVNDLLYRHRKLKRFSGRRIDSPNTHGTSYTLFSVIASNPAKGMNMDLAVERAKVYLSGALEAQLGLGKGSGSTNHGFAIRGEY